MQNGIRKNKKIISIVICAVIVFTMFFSVAFMATHASHNCTGEKCTVCQIINSTIKTFDHFTTTFSILVFISLLIFLSLIHINDTNKSMSVTTPVTLKVKLSN